MNQTQADALAQRITQTWRNAAVADLWAEELVDLHYNQAEETYKRLRRESETTPSIARFIATYNTLTRPERQWSKPDPGGPPMSFDEYIGRLSIRASKGDPEAMEMLDIWADNQERGLSVKQMGWTA